MSSALGGGFFDRADPAPDSEFYSWPRFVTHIDAAAIAAVGELYEELRIEGDVLDLMSSWVSHFRHAPARLTVLGMNEAELSANPQAAAWVVHDLNADPRVPFQDEAFDAAVCCVSVDYLTRPLEVLADVARVLRPGAPFVCTFSNRCFLTKAITGWLSSSNDDHCSIVAGYFRSSNHWIRRRSRGGLRRITSVIHSLQCGRTDGSASFESSDRGPTRPPGRPTADLTQPIVPLGSDDEGRAERSEGVTPSANESLEPLDRSWAVLLTTFKRDGSPVGTPVNLAVEGNHVYFRSYNKAWKTKRIANNPEVDIAPSTIRGKPTGSAVRATARLLSGDEEVHARRLLAARYPVFQRLVIPAAHTVARYSTMHYEVSVTTTP